MPYLSDEELSDDEELDVESFRLRFFFTELKIFRKNTVNSFNLENALSAMALRQDGNYQLSKLTFIEKIR